MTDSDRSDYVCPVCDGEIPDDEYIVLQKPDSYTVYHVGCWAVDAVPMQELEALADDLDVKAVTHARKAGEASSDEGTSYGEGLSHAFEHSAEKLQDVIADYGDTDE